MEAVKELLRILEGIVPDDSHLEEIDENDLVIGVLTEGEQKINTYLNQLSIQFADKVKKDERNAAWKLHNRIETFRRIMWFLINDRLVTFDDENDRLQIKKGFKVVSVKDPLGGLIEDLLENLRNLDDL